MRLKEQFQHLNLHPYNHQVNHQVIHCQHKLVHYQVNQHQQLQLNLQVKLELQVRLRVWVHLEVLQQVQKQRLLVLDLQEGENLLNYHQVQNHQVTSQVRSAPDEFSVLSLCLDLPPPSSAQPINETSVYVNLHFGLIIDFLEFH